MKARGGWLALLPCLLLVACSTPGPRGYGEMSVQIVPVQIENDLRTRSDVTIRMVSSDGSVSLLGSVSPGRDRTLEFRERVLAGPYRLTATTGDGSMLESRRFTLFEGAAVIWQLQFNDLQVVTAESIGADA